MRRTIWPNATIATIAVLALALGNPAGATVRHAFITSSSGPGSLSSWSGDPADGLTGIAAANRICQNAAEQSSFAAVSSNSTAFHAWISTSSSDAYCNVLGLSGKAPNCGQALPPAPNIGPWMFANGISRWAQSLGGLLDGSPEIWTGMFRDEDFASHVVSESFYWTGTGKDGRSAGPNCNNWTSSSPDVEAKLGDGNGTSVLWSEFGDYPCSANRRLLCLENGVGEPQNQFWLPAALAFVTSETYTAILGDADEANGATAGNAARNICRARAAAGHLPEPDTFVAYISDNIGPDAIDWLTWEGTYRRLDGTSLGGKTDLLDGVAGATLHQTELGTYIDDFHFVWTGTLYDGETIYNDCGSWKVLNELGAQGSASKFRNGEWSYSQIPNCQGQLARLYCFGTRVVLFWDGFEYDGLARWTMAQGAP